MSENTEKSASINWKVALGCGAVLLFGAVWYLKFNKQCKTKDALLVKQLKKKIQSSSGLAQQSLKPLTVLKEKRISDDQISMKFNLVANLKLKNKEFISNPKNPFIPPFEKGMLITQLPPKHRLIYNKFNVIENHLLIVTHQFEDQTNPLTKQDFYQCALVISALNGLFFFNYGPYSGYSQKHKHMQIFPNQAFNFPIIAQILSQIAQNKLIRLSRSNICLFNNFQFIHAIVLMNPQKDKEGLSLDDMATQFLNAYKSMKKMLSAALKEQQYSYNIIGCKQFMLIVPRKKQFIFQNVGINAVGFIGSILLKDEELFDKIQYLSKPSDILREITFTEKSK